MKPFTPLVLLSSLALASPTIAAPDVVASIKPVHSLVAAVMAGVGEPVLIVRGAASPHTYALRPSDAGALETADIVFWTGHGLELFLGDALETLATEAKVVELARSPGIELLPLREGGAFEVHAHESDDHDHADHDHDHDHEHEHDAGDMHFWLDPHNAALMVSQIATTLSEADPDNAATYAANAEIEIAALAALAGELAERLAPVRNKPFIVFHDAYQYFEARFGLGDRLARRGARRCPYR
jgi:zinc transport system substrate-binding protein